MKIQFTRSGGFAGPAMKQNLTLDTSDLSETEANELTNLVTQANLPALSGETEGTTTPRPDEFHYRISVEDEGQSQSVRASDSSMPETLGPLVDWLSERATR